MPQALAVLAGGAAGHLLERPGEIGRVLEASLIADAGDRHLAVLQQLLGVIHAPAKDVFHEADPVDLLEQPAEAKGRHAAALGELLLVHAFAEILVDVGHHLVQRLVLLVARRPANAVREGRVAVEYRRSAQIDGGASHFIQLPEGVQIAALLFCREWQHHVLPYLGTHRPYGKFFRMLHGEHGDRDRRV
ncbi:hypothetical protein D3C85_1341270 [compost metagenome]